MPSSDWDTVLHWLAAVNQANLQALLAYSNVDIRLQGPRGSGTGHALLAGWLVRARLQLQLEAGWERPQQMLIAGCGSWGAAPALPVGLWFEVSQGRVRAFAREAALAERLTREHWIPVSGLWLANRQEILDRQRAHAQHQADQQPE